MLGSNKIQEGYFSLDEILSTNERLSCCFELPVRKLGYLDPSSDDDDLVVGTKLDLPAWLAVNLHDRHIVSVQLPKQYQEAYREILNADATVVDLHKLGPYFYDFGMFFQRITHPEAAEIMKILSQTFRNRLKRIIDFSQNSCHDDIADLTQHLDRTELQLFHLGQKSFMDFNQWQARKFEKITTANMVLNFKKRKHAEMST